MKYISLFLLIFLISCNKSDSVIKVKPILSKIDSLNSEGQVEDYFHSLDSNYRKFKLQKFENLNNRFDSILFSRTRAIAKKYNINKTFYKADLDNNGYIDLLVIGDNRWCDPPKGTCSFATYIVMNFGKDSVNVCNIVRQENYAVVPQIIKVNNKSSLIIHNPGRMDWATRQIVNKDSIRLVYRYNNFIEYNNKPVDNKIEKIEFTTSGCFGTCPIFQITIDKTRQGLFIADYYNFSIRRPRGGDQKENLFFKAEIDTASYNHITGLLNYIDFENLNKEYSVMWTDDQTSVLKITYSDGKVKVITDYGLSGTYGLKAVYDIFFKLRFNQKWEKTAEPKGVRLDSY